MSQLTPKQQKQILDIALIKGDFTFASGLKSSEKFEFDNISSDSAELNLLIDGLAEAIQMNFGDIDAIVTVANGATRLGEPIASKLGVVHVPTAYKLASSKIFYLPDPIKPSVHTVVIVDDVYTRGTTTSKVAEVLSTTGIQVKGAVVICDRSNYQAPSFNIGDVSLPVYSLIKYYMPIKEGNRLHG